VGGTHISKVSMCCVSKGSRRSDEEALEEQVRKLGEELREVRELYETEQDKTRSNGDDALQLHNQVHVSLSSCELKVPSDMIYTQ